MSLAFAPDSKWLAFGCSGEEGFKRGVGKAIDQVRLWDVVRGAEVRRFDGVGQLFVQSVQFPPDGQLLAAGNWDGSIELWETLSGRLRWRSKPRIAGQCIAFSPDGRMLASTGDSGNVCLWETATGVARRVWKGHLGLNVAVAFAPDGRTVATGSMDTTVLLWDVHGLHSAPKAEAPEHWKALADGDAAKAYDAVLALAAAPEATVAFLRGQLRPAPSAAARVKELLADLDSDEFDRREKATRALRQLGAAAEPALRKVYQASPSLEVRVRAGRLLDELARHVLSPEELRTARRGSAGELQDRGLPQTARNAQPGRSRGVADQGGEGRPGTATRTVMQSRKLRGLSMDNVTLDDYEQSLEEVERRCPNLLPMLPGIDPFHGLSGYSAVPRVRRMIAALTAAERANPTLLTPERLAEAAATARVLVWEVEQFLAEFAEFQACIRHVAALNWWQRLKLALGWSRFPL